MTELPATPSASPEGEPRPFVVPCAVLGFDAPLRWLRLGWQDVRRAPSASLWLGVLVFLLSAGVVGLGWYLGRFALLAALLSGFVYVAPLLGVSLYGVSRALQHGQQPSLRASFRRAGRVLGQAGVFALMQMVVLMVWSRSGMMLSAFFPVEEGQWPVLLEYLAVGSLIGSVFAALTFALTAVSLPMIADREVDMVTAVVSSVNAVLRNKAVMAWWALLLALWTGLGLLTAGLGLIVILPWLAYASWHAYRETLDASSWPALD